MWLREFRKWLKHTKTAWDLNALGWGGWGGGWFIVCVILKYSPCRHLLLSSHIKHLVSRNPPLINWSQMESFFLQSCRVIESPPVHLMQMLPLITTLTSIPKQHVWIEDSGLSAKLKSKMLSLYTQQRPLLPQVVITGCWCIMSETGYVRKALFDNRPHERTGNISQTKDCPGNGDRHLMMYHVLLFVTGDGPRRCIQVPCIECDTPQYWNGYIYSTYSYYI